MDPATFPNFNIGFGLAGLSSFQNIGEDITLQNNFTRISGRHTLKLGYELIRTRYNATVAVLPSGTYNFGGTNAPFTPNTGQTFASFLLGTVTSATSRKGLQAGCRAGGPTNGTFRTTGNRATA